MMQRIQHSVDVSAAILMTKTFLLTILSAVIFTSCATPTNKREPEEGVKQLDLVKYDTSKIAFIALDSNSTYPFDGKAHEPANLTQNDLAQIDSLLLACATEYNNSLTHGKDDFKIDINRINYKMQLISVTNKKGEKEVWVNCFCQGWNERWKTEIFSVDDGGPCYFNFKINLATSKFYELVVNGFA